MRFSCVVVQWKELKETICWIRTTKGITLKRLCICHTDHPDRLADRVGLLQALNSHLIDLLAVTGAEMLLPEGKRLASVFDRVKLALLLKLLVEEIEV
jgi:hypothetical protein